MDVLFYILCMQNVIPEPKNFLSIYLSFVDMLVSMVNGRDKIKGK